MLLQQIEEGFLTTEFEVKLNFHYERQKKPSNHWIVWQEEGEEADFQANNRKSKQQGNGTVVCFTKFK